MLPSDTARPSPPSTSGTPVNRVMSDDVSRRNTQSTIRMNPYVRCVRGGPVDAVPEVRSLSELLVAPTDVAAAEMDTPCLRPNAAPSPVVRSFAAPGVDVLTSQRRGSQCGTDGSDEHATDDGDRRRVRPTTGSPGPASPPRGVRATASSPPLHFTHEGVATPNSFASVRKLEAWLRLQQQQAAQAHKAGVPHIDLGRLPRLGHADGGMAEALAMRLPASTDQNDDDDDEDGLNKESSLNAASLPADNDQVDQAHLPRTDVAETQPNNRIVSPRSSSRVPSPSPSRTDASRAAIADDAADITTPTDVNAPRGGPEKGRAAHRTATRAFPAAPHPLSLAPSSGARTMEGSPYHYLMRNYVGGTFLYYAHPESKKYFLDLCYRIVDQVRPILEQETLFPQCGLFPRLSAPAFVLGDIHGNFEDLSFFLKRLLVFHDFNLTPSNLLCLGDYVDRGPFSLECVMLLLSLKVMNASKIVMLRGNHEDRVVCGDLQTYGRGCFLAQCHAVFGYDEGMKLFRAVTGLFRYLPLAAELVIPSAPNASYLRARSQFASFNVYGTETSRTVPIHGTPAVLSPMSPPTSAQTFHGAADGAASSSGSSSSMAMPLRFPSGLEATAVGAEGGGHDSPRCACTPLPAREGQEANLYSTILVANTSLGQPTREEAHEERILCTHGGIPRFFCPPREDGALEFLRSLRFPRLLTLFPNNPLAMADEECAPEYYFNTLLPRLVRQYPQLGRMGLAEMEESMATAYSSEEGAAYTPAASGSTAQHPADAAALLASSSDAPPSPLPAATTATTATNAVKDAHAGRPTDVPALATVEALLAKVSYSNDDLRRAWFITFDLLWSDPTPTEPDRSAQPGRDDGPSASTRVNEWGFGINTRGSHVVSFTARAVERFLADYNYAMLFRAHQEKTHGLRWCKSNKVLTVFSSSNYLGHGNGAGCVVLSVNGEVQMIEKMGFALA